MTAKQIIQLRAPTFYAYAAIDTWIALAEAQVGTGGNPDLRSMEVALLVCHWLALDLRNTMGTAGVVTSESEGSLSRSYSVNSSGDAASAYFSQTTWGVELLNLRASTICLPTNRMIG